MPQTNNKQKVDEGVLEVVESKTSPRTLTLAKEKNKSINLVLDMDIENIEDFKKLEKENKGIKLNHETIRRLFKKYPHLNLEDFKNYFFGTYNKIILISSPEIVDLIDLQNIKPGDDIIENILGKVAMNEEEFTTKTKGKLDFLTFPNMSEGSVSQKYFYDKIGKSLPGTEIIFGDNPKIREKKGINEFECDSVGHIDIMGKGIFNMCIFKLLKTSPDEKKTEELNKLFETVEKDIFIGGSSTFIPFDVPNDMLGISFPKSATIGGGLKLINKTVQNSMGYLNSAYYTDKTKAVFVFGTHNIAEPLHAGKLTVISNDPKNRYNHNWLIAYFGEKASLLSITEGSQEEQQKEVEGFLSITSDELKRRYEVFAHTYEEKIIPAVYGIFYNYLKNTFPNKFN